MSTRHRRDDGAGLGAADRRRRPESELPKADDQAARLARMQLLLAALDRMHDEAARICDVITAEAHRANDAAPKAARRRGRKKKKR
jgi:hypothetical protein